MLNKSSNFFENKKQLTDPKLLNSSVFKKSSLINHLLYSEGISGMVELPKNFIAAAMDKEIGNNFSIKRMLKNNGILNKYEKIYSRWSSKNCHGPHKS